MSNKEMTNYEKIEALRKKANIIIAIDGGLRMFGAPVLGTLAVLGINKKFVKEDSLFKTNKTIALGAESILVSNAIEGAMSAITKRILRNIAEEIDSLAAADEEADENIAVDYDDMEHEPKCSCGGTCGENCHCHENIDFDENMEDPDAENVICCDKNDFIAAKELIENEYSGYKIIRIVFKNEDYEDKSCFPLVRHFVSDGTEETDARIHVLIEGLANTVGEHTTPDGTEWNGEPAKFEVSAYGTDYIVENYESINDIIKCAEMLVSANKLKSEHPDNPFAYCYEYDKVGIYSDALLNLEDECDENDYDEHTFRVEIKYTLPDGSTDTATVDIEEESPILAVSEVFNIFQLVAGCENNVDCVVLGKIIPEDEDIDEDETDGNVEAIESVDNKITEESNGGNE